MTDFKTGLMLLERNLRDKNRSKYTIISYMNDLRQLVNFLKTRGRVNFDSTTLEDLNAFKQKFLDDENYTTKSVSRKVNSVRLLFRHLNEIGKIPKNTGENLRHPKFKNAVPRVLSKTEYMAIRDASRANPKFYSIIQVLLQTGIRVGELVRLHITDIKAINNKNYLSIMQYQSQPARNVPINDMALDAVKKWLAVRPKVDSPYIYITRTSKPIIVRNLRTSLLRIFKKAGVNNATVNDLRNTFIAYYVAKGVPKAEIAKLVGHKNLSTVDRYRGLFTFEKKDSLQGKELVL